MADEHEFEQAFQNAVHSLMRYFAIVDATVTAVDADPTNPNSTYTCTCEIGDTAFYSVPLRVLTGSQAWFIEVPMVGTDCLITFRDGNMGRPQLYEVDQVQDVFLANKGDFHIDPGGVTKFNGGQQGGVPLVIPLTDALNTIQKDLNTIKQVFAVGWTPVPNDGGAALKAAAGAWAGAALPVTQQSDLENSKILQ